MPLTSVIGRERLVASVAALLCREEVRLLTLTGTGGVDKTRLALGVAEEVAQEFPGGVFFVPLAPVEDPDLVWPAVGRAVGVAGPSDAVSLFPAGSMGEFSMRWNPFREHGVMFHGSDTPWGPEPTTR